MTKLEAFETPELAASSKNERLRPVAVDFDASHKRATVLVLTPSGDRILRYCTLTQDGWVQSDRDPASSADLAWSSEFASNDPEPVLTFAKRVPQGAQGATVRFAGKDRQVDAPHGYFIASWWGPDAESVEDEQRPTVVKYHR